MNRGGRIFCAVVRNDLRLFLRGLMGRRGWATAPAAVWALLYAAGNLVAIIACFVLGHPPSPGAQALIWSFFAFFMLSAAMLASVTLLFERADGDLLLASPASPAVLLLARLASLTASTFLSVSLLANPVLDGAILGFSPRFAWGYGVWALLAAAMAAAGMGITLLLVALLGARRARVAAQVIATLFSVGGYLFFQFGNMARTRGGSAPLFAAYARAARRLGFDRVALASQGSLPNLGLLAIAALGGCLLMAWSLRRGFVAGLQESDTRASKGGPGKAPRRWSPSLSTNAFLKDVRLIWRDPLLLVQVAPQAVYILPAFFGIGRGAHLGIMSLGIAGFVLACVVSPLLTAVCVNGEEGWDLIRLSPTPEIKLRRSKVAAGMALPLAVASALCLAVACGGRPGIALLSLGISFLSAAALSSLEAAWINPTPRKDVLRSRRGGFHLSVIAAALTAVFGAGGLGLAAAGHAYFALAGYLLLSLVAIAMALLLATARFHAARFTDD